MTTPRLTVGLPVHNGENFLAASIDSLRRQTLEDFELIISDNASEDGTSDICRQYEKQDDRIRWFRQPRNIGLAANHNFVVEKGRADLFKWASHDDVYAPSLLQRCVEALDGQPDAVLSHAWCTLIDGSGLPTQDVEYGPNTESPHPPERFRSLLLAEGGDDDGGVIRMDVLRRVAKKNSYHHADHTIIAEIALYGRFFQVPERLYFRRDHPDRAERACPTMRSRCVNMDPRRANRLRHPAVRLYGEYVWAYADAIRRSPLPPAQRRECYRHLAEWLALRVTPSRPGTAARRPRQDSNLRPAA